LDAVVEKRQSFGRSGTRHVGIFSWGAGLRLRGYRASPPVLVRSLYWPRARKASALPPAPAAKPDSSLNIQGFPAKPDPWGWAPGDCRNDLEADAAAARPHRR